MIIVLDGSKGAGKTSVSKILLKEVKDAIFLSFDEERKLFPHTYGTSGIHEEPFDSIIKKAIEHLKNVRNLIIDCGLTKDRVSELEKIARDYNSKLYKFFLKGSYDTLLERVYLRDKSKGKETNVKRFEEVYNIVHSKEFDDFYTIETDNLNVEKVAGKILEIIE